MAKIRELFVKEIDRRINGVIKADSQEEKEFKEEIDEYVITSELTGRFNELLDRYMLECGFQDSLDQENLTY
jgi:hypothetical protein